jgi:hypothetical protein
MARAVNTVQATGIRANRLRRRMLVKKFSLLVVLICGMFTVTAMAQGSSESGINQNSGNSPHSTIQGCVVQSGHNYYLQPARGIER